MDLTKKQKVILTLVTCGMNYKEIAAVMGISVRTVQNHMARIFSRTQTNSRTGAMLQFLKSNPENLAELEKEKICARIPKSKRKKTA